MPPRLSRTSFSVEEGGGAGSDHLLDNPCSDAAELVFDAIEAELERRGIDP